MCRETRNTVMFVDSLRAVDRVQNAVERPVGFFSQYHVRLIIRVSHRPDRGLWIPSIRAFEKDGLMWLFEL
jgi:hypothetical protein